MSIRVFAKSVRVSTLVSLLVTGAVIALLGAVMWPSAEVRRILFAVVIFAGIATAVVCSVGWRNQFERLRAQYESLEAQGDCTSQRVTRLEAMYEAHTQDDEAGAHMKVVIDHLFNKRKQVR